MKQFDKSFFAHRLLLKQKVLELTIRKASTEIGISASTLSRLNNKLFIPDIITYYKCCKWMGLDMEFFFTNINIK